MKTELVVISGKGGTGKTSVAASLAVLAGPVVLADCDVDAADLHLLMSPEVRITHEFMSGNEAVIDQARCIRCGICASWCAFDAIRTVADPENGQRLVVDRLACEGCGVCAHYCPAKAIDFPERWRGRWFESETRCGPMVHACLDVGAGNSGKLVTQVRRRASEIAVARGLQWVITDGPPGVGCPVIASLTGATHVLAVTEPGVSGRHDLKRLLQLTRHFSIPSFVCVNRYDLDESAMEEIGSITREHGATLLGGIPWDPGFSEMQHAGKTVVEGSGPGALRIREIWEKLRTLVMDMKDTE